ncbi:hypothetical protein C0Q70_14123 [Pomacea canaliculata]|uniref:Uncharacterized protein n=1 Tax=Pomacea canaliculata TaxID=400727 RepID=A0A2T7NZ59_POMCA|nr:hypothetical protein C0Q70_14123 [Pomacea canaliculata]
MERGKGLSGSASSIDVADSLRQMPRLYCFTEIFSSTRVEVPNKSIFDAVLNKSTTDAVLNKSTTDAVLNKSTTDAVLNKSTTDAVLNKSTTDAVLNKSTTDAVSRDEFFQMTATIGRNLTFF